MGKNQHKLAFVAIGLSVISLLFQIWPEPTAAQTTIDAIPQIISYQGRLTDTVGVPIDGSVDMQFCLYAEPMGGASLWCEVYETANGNEVVVSYGVFQVDLGTVNPLPDSLFDQSNLFLGISVAGEEEISPRRRLNSVGYAFRASMSESAISADFATSAGDADTVDGLHATDFAGLNDGVPTGAIILWTGLECPTGYARNTDYDDYFLVAAATSGVTGGSNTHNHGGNTGSHALTINQIPPHTHGLKGHANGGGEGPNWFPNLSDPVFTYTQSAGGGAGHSHTIASADNRPEYKTILLCERE